MLVVNDNINHEYFSYVIECDISYAYINNIVSLYGFKNDIKLYDYDKTVRERDNFED